MCGHFSWRKIWKRKKGGRRHDETQGAFPETHFCGSESAWRFPYACHAGALACSRPISARQNRLNPVPQIAAAACVSYRVSLQLPTNDIKFGSARFGRRGRICYGFTGVFGIFNCAASFENCAAGERHRFLHCAMVRIAFRHGAGGGWSFPHGYILLMQGIVFAGIRRASRNFWHFCRTWPLAKQTY